MKNNEVIILSNKFSNTIFSPGECETCKCFTDLTNDENAIYKYNCLVKEGDTFCNTAQKLINSLMKAEKVTNMEDYINRLRAIKNKNRKND